MVFSLDLFGLQIAEIIKAITNIKAFNHASWYNCVLFIIRQTMAGCHTKIYRAKKIRSQFVMIYLLFN
jgi:hypothetical protein